MVEAASLRLVDLLAVLVDPRQLPSISGVWARLEAQRSVAIDTPWAMAVLRALEVPSMRGDPATISSGLRRDRQDIDRCLEGLEAAGLARKVQGTWRPVAMGAVDTRRTPETARRLKAFWARVGVERLEAGVDGGFAYNLVSVSLEQLHRLREAHDAYFQAVRSIVAEDAPPDCVALICLQVVRLDDTRTGA